MWWQEYWMKDVASQQSKVEHDCAVSRIPLMLLDVIKNTNGTAAAVENTRNELVRRQDEGLVQQDRFLQMVEAAQVKRIQSADPA